MGPIAFFCCEYAIEDNLHLYAGGLGVLAGDMVLEAGDQGLPFHAFGLFYHQQEPDPSSAGFKILLDARGEEILVDVEIADRPVLARTWIKEYKSARLYLLDTNINANTLEDREITTVLYGPTLEAKLREQLILCFGGVKVLQRLGINPEVYHLNEGHTAMTLFALAADYLAKNSQSTLPDALAAIKPKIVASKHTILTGAGVYLDRTNFDQNLKFFLTRRNINPDEAFSLAVGTAHPDKFSTTKFLLDNCSRSNCVSKVHCQYELGIHPNSPLIPITNGVYPGRWAAKNFLDLDLATISDEKLHTEHFLNKQELFAKIGEELKPKVLTIVWARRITAYKQPDLLFKNLDRLKAIVNHPEQPVQFIISGQPGKEDTLGQDTVRQIKSACALPELKNKVVYIPNYSLLVAKTLVKGADVWLNTPQVGKEACGTSGMKAGLNGALVFSTNDGWVAENVWDGMGWILPQENISEQIYSLIENDIAPTYYQNGKDWTNRIRRTMQLIRENYTSKVMLDNYVQKLYFPAALGVSHPVKANYSDQSSLNNFVAA